MKGRPIPYSADEMAWLAANRALPIGEYHSGFCGAFGRHDVSAVNLHSLRKRKGWKTGRTGCFEKGSVPFNKGKPCLPGTGGRHPNARATQFRKGGLPHNTKFAGHERISKDGYVEVSVEETNPHTGFERRYVLKHRWLWEKVNGPVPEGMCLKCRGDRLNTDPSNWELVPRALLPRLDGRFGRRYEDAPAELKPTIMAVAKLEHSVRLRCKGAPKL
jgi:HNH endonuclease